jgi:uncharacterized membrane protein
VETQQCYFLYYATFFIVTIKKYNTRDIIWLILIYFLVLAGRHVGKSELVYFGGDESRHFMNGVFIKDLIADGGWRFPFEYLKWYYLKYPALSIHQYPPLFYFLEALVFALFGIHVAVVQVLIFTIIGVGLYYWYRYIKTKFNPEVALLSLLVFISTPLFLTNFSRIMLDGISLALTLVLIYALDRWHASGNRNHLYLALTLLLILLLIAFTTYFLLFYLVLLVVYQKSSGKSIRKQWMYLLVSFLTIFALFFTFGTIAIISRVPLLYRTFQGINMINIYTVKRIILSQNVRMLFHFEFRKVFGVTGILLTLIGILCVARNKEWGKITSEILYAANFLFIFTLCITHFEPGRFHIFLLPCFALLSGYALYNMVTFLKGKTVYIGLSCAVIFYVGKGFYYPPMYFRGYEQAASDLLSMNKTNAPILCDAYLDGTFIAYMRKYDPSKQQIIFRGDKILFASSIYYRDIKETYAENKEDIYNILDGYSIRYIVVDDLFLEIKQKTLLRDVLKHEKDFRHLKTYKVSTNERGFNNHADLNVYEYLHYKTDDNQLLKISLPVMNTAFSFTVRDLKKPFGERTFNP